MPLAAWLICCHCVPAATTSSLAVGCTSMPEGPAHTCCKQKCGLPQLRSSAAAVLAGVSWLLAGQRHPEPPQHRLLDAPAAGIQPAQLHILRWHKLPHPCIRLHGGWYAFPQARRRPHVTPCALQDRLYFQLAALRPSACWPQARFVSSRPCNVCSVANCPNADASVDVALRFAILVRATAGIDLNSVRQRIRGPCAVLGVY